MLAAAWNNCKIIAAVCHGPAGLLNVKDSTEKPLIAGRQISAFSNTEEVAADRSETVPFPLESRLRELGADYRSGPNFESFAIRDGNLITDQNPASSEAVARLTLEAVRISSKQ